MNNRAYDSVEFWNQAVLYSPYGSEIEKLTAEVTKQLIDSIVWEHETSMDSRFITINPDEVVDNTSDLDWEEVPF